MFGRSLYKCCSPFCHKVLEVIGEDPKWQFRGWLRRNQESKIKSRTTNAKVHRVLLCRQTEMCLCFRECVVQISAFSDLIHNVVQKFKDGHGRSTVHPMSCGEVAYHRYFYLKSIYTYTYSFKSNLKQAFLVNYI